MVWGELFKEHMSNKNYGQFVTITDSKSSLLNCISSSKGDWKIILQLDSNQPD